MGWVRLSQVHCGDTGTSIGGNVKVHARLQLQHNSPVKTQTSEQTHGVHCLKLHISRVTNGLGLKRLKVSKYTHSSAILGKEDYWNCFFSDQDFTPGSKCFRWKTQTTVKHYLYIDASWLTMWQCPNFCIFKAGLMYYRVKDYEDSFRWTYLKVVQS